MSLNFFLYLTLRTNIAKVTILTIAETASTAESVMQTSTKVKELFMSTCTSRQFLLARETNCRQDGNGRK